MWGLPRHRRVTVLSRATPDAGAFITKPERPPWNPPQPRELFADRGYDHDK
jgi:hypothetical protein